MRAGQQPQNPLLLLGQYSDDELDDDSNQVLSNAAVGNSSPENNDEVIKWISLLSSMSRVLSNLELSLLSSLVSWALL